MPGGLSCGRRCGRSGCRTACRRCCCGTWAGGGRIPCARPHLPFSTTTCWAALTSRRGAFPSTRACPPWSPRSSAVRCPAPGPGTPVLSNRCIFMSSCMLGNQSCTFTVRITLSTAAHHMLVMAWHMWGQHAPCWEIEDCSMGWTRHTAPQVLHICLYSEQSSSIPEELVPFADPSTLIISWAWPPSCLVSLTYMFSFCQARA